MIAHYSRWVDLCVAVLIISATEDAGFFPLLARRNKLADGVRPLFAGVRRPTRHSSKNAVAKITRGDHMPKYPDIKREYGRVPAHRTLARSCAEHCEFLGAQQQSPGSTPVDVGAIRPFNFIQLFTKRDPLNSANTTRRVFFTPFRSIEFFCTIRADRTNVQVSGAARTCFIFAPDRVITITTEVP